jgi:hypothetical protein
LWNELEDRPTYFCIEHAVFTAKLDGLHNDVLLLDREGGALVIDFLLLQFVDWGSVHLGEVNLFYYDDFPLLGLVLRN